MAQQNRRALPLPARMLLHAALVAAGYLLLMGAFHVTGLLDGSLGTVDLITAAGVGLAMSAFPLVQARPGWKRPLLVLAMIGCAGASAFYIFLAFTGSVESGEWPFFAFVLAFTIVGFWMAWTAYRDQPAD